MADTSTDIEIVNTASYSVENASENPTELPQVEGLDPKERMMGIAVDKGLIGAAPHVRTMAGSLVRKLWGSPVFRALVERGDLVISRGRVLVPRAA